MKRPHYNAPRLSQRDTATTALHDPCLDRHARSEHRSRPTRTTISLLALMAALSPVEGQREPPPVRQLESPEAVSPANVVFSVAALRALSPHAVIVNDVVGRRVVLLDNRFRLVKVLADTSVATRRLYGRGASGLFAKAPDSTLFLSGSTLSMAVLDADGNIARIVAPPRPSDFGQLVGGAAGNPGFDGRGRLVYRAVGIPLAEQLRRGAVGLASPPDSVPLVRFDFTMRRLDTVSFIRVYTPRVEEVRSSTIVGGAQSYATRLNPVLHPAPTVDDWAIMADGTIAIVRGHDYHVDFIDAYGRTFSSAAIPFPWRRLSDADKVALIDSSKAIRARMVASGSAPGYGIAPLPGSEALERPSVSVVTGNASTSASATSAPAAEDRYVDPDELPDYQPVFASGGVRADADGNLWIRTIATAPLRGGAIYHVIDRQGNLIDRVQVPRSATIAGFAPGGIVFLARREGTAVVLARVRHRLPNPR